MLIDPTSITGLTADSRAVERGFLFAAIKGENLDGNDYIDQAIANGATAILTDADLSLPDHITLIKVDNVRLALSQIASDFYPNRPANIVAVTGTNGKSSIVTFLEQIWQAEGVKAASLGTLSGGLTSPDPIALHKHLSDLHEQGITHLAIEASSHGLDQHRMDGVIIQAAGFTNLSHDHLDYHAGMDEYLGAKMRLFTGILPDDGVAVLNADTPEFEKIRKNTRGNIISYGYKGEHLKIIAVTPAQNGTKVALEIFGQPFTVEIPLIGDFQLSNILCALGLSFLNKKPNRIVIESKIKTLEAIKPAKGRLQPILGHPSGAAIYIDYAHTPDALRSVLNTVRVHAKGAVYCVFGCGGDRDKSKRPVMGRIASQLADKVILTDDNPRSENSVDIISQILAGIQKNMHNENVIEISDRSAAINHSIQQLTKNDILVIAGKGHEAGQILESGIIPFDDTEEALKAIAALNKK